MPLNDIVVCFHSIWRTYRTYVQSNIRLFWRCDTYAVLFCVCIFNIFYVLNMNRIPSCSFQQEPKREGKDKRGQHEQELRNESKSKQAEQINRRGKTLNVYYV